MIKQLGKIGKKGEQIAVVYLLKKGYYILFRNWRKVEGEIDIISYDRLTKELVFVEVKTRKSMSFGEPEESISLAKKKRLQNIISRFLMDNSYAGKYRCDGIFIIQKPGYWKLRQIKNIDIGD